MSRDIRAIARLKEGNICFNACMLIGMAALMIVISLIIASDEPMNVEDMRNMILMGTGAGYIGANIFFKVFYISDEVPKGLTFGMTRKKLFIGCRIVDFLELLILTLVTIVAFRELDAAAVLKVAAIIFGIFMWTEGLVGNNIVRYGKIVYWIYYICIMFCSLGLPRLLKFIPNSVTSMIQVYDYVINPFFNQGLVWTVILVFVASGTIVNWLTFRTLAVNYNL